MQTLSGSAELVRVVNDHLRAGDLDQLSEAQAAVVSAVVDRWYGVPVGMPDAETRERWRRGEL